MFIFQVIGSFVSFWLTKLSHPQTKFRLQSLFAGGLLLIAQQVCALSYTLEISEAELQEEISHLKPLKKKTLFMTVIFSHPKLDLAVGHNQIGISAQLDAIAPVGMQSTGQAKINGSLHFNAESGVFYFKNPKLVEIQLADVPSAYLPVIKELAQWLIDRKLANLAIYKLKDSELTQRLLKSSLKTITVANQQLQIELELF